MKAILGFISFVLVASGVTGLLHQWVDWMPTIFGFSRFIVPDGHEVLGYVVMTLLGGAVGFLSDAVKKHVAA
ncbi:hypothetical protein [Streptomyces sp. NBC_01716]|uniref:hypothetical protein n=1 Tax=Streptomyces sp. NBC_01716 TaxID=2975917 RepID=UPI002E338130|nr:hypothetical protein [Streptomyces sp. NBC_01716]